MKCRTTNRAGRAPPGWFSGTGPYWTGGRASENLYRPFGPGGRASDFCTGPSDRAGGPRIFLYRPGRAGGPGPYFKRSIDMKKKTNAALI